jgi:Na+-translocating ferredoxin:NAD+ oxidoreductase RnfE subunit
MKLFLNAVFSNQVIVYSGLGLFLLLAGSQSFTLALGMSIAFILNISISTFLVYVLKKSIQQEIKFIAYLIIFATVSTLVSMMMSALMPVWIEGLSLYLPLIALSGVSQYRAEMIQPTTKISAYMIENLGIGVGFAMMIIILGMTTEVLGTGIISLKSLTVASESIFSIEILDENFINGAFSGSFSYIGSLLLFGLVIAFIQSVNMKRSLR